MATNFPTSIDDFTDYVDGTTVIVAATLNNMQKAIEALEVKVGVDESAVTSSHDYLLNNIGDTMSWNYDGTKVFNGYSTAPPTSFEDLDLSSYVGANRALCLLKATIYPYQPGRIGNYDYTVIYTFKTKGETDDQDYGGSKVKLSVDELADDVDANGMSFFVMTNEDGVVEWKTSGDTIYNGVNIYLEGYIVEGI